MLVWRTAIARDTTVGIVFRTACKAAWSQRMTALSPATRLVRHGLSARAARAMPPAISSARTGQSRARLDPGSRMLRIMGDIRKFVVLVLAAAAIPVAVGCATD